MNNVKWSNVSGSSTVRVGHCIHRYDCNGIPVCTGTDCESYRPTNPQVAQYTVEKNPCNFPKSSK
jgi:hypothetical protein